MIHFDKVSKQYKSNQVLSPFSLTIEKGQSFGIIGPNGAGKSTFLKLLASLEKPTDGTIYYQDVPYAKAVKKLRDEIGYVPQDIALYDELTVKEQLAFWRRISRRKPDKAFMEKMIQTLRLQEVYHQRVSKLSGGWRRKVNLCVGFMNNPSICLLDEPTAGIDLAAKEDIFSWLTSLRDEGRTIIYISHDWYELKQLSEEYMLFAKGKPLLKANYQELKDAKYDILQQFPEEHELHNILKFVG